MYEDWIIKKTLTELWTNQLETQYIFYRENIDRQ